MEPELEVIVHPESVWMVAGRGKVPVQSMHQLLCASCLGGPFLVVTETPQRMSWCWGLETVAVLSQKEELAAGENFCITVLPSGTAEMMEELATEEELYRGLLWVSPEVALVSGEELFEMREWLSSATSESEVPKQFREHVACLSDGSEALWCHPSQTKLAMARDLLGW